MASIQEKVTIFYSMVNSIRAISAMEKFIYMTKFSTFLS
jgi:hypothetical protein